MPGESRVTRIVPKSLVWLPASAYSGEEPHRHSHPIERRGSSWSAHASAASPAILFGLAAITSISPAAALSGDTLTQAERASAVNTALTRRLAVARDSIRLQPCSRYLGLGRDTAFRERLRLRLWLRAAVTSETVGSGCDALMGASVPAGTWLLKAVERASEGRITVRASTVSTPAFDGTYVVRQERLRDGSFHYRVEEIRYSHFMDS